MALELISFREKKTMANDNTRTIITDNNFTILVTIYLVSCNTNIRLSCVLRTDKEKSFGYLIRFLQKDLSLTSGLRIEYF